VSELSTDSPPRALSPQPSLPSLKRTETASSHDDGFQTQIGSVPSTESVDKPVKQRKRANTRRHQIPGLRKTPYLKVLLVRCDDNDSYKSSVRQEIRDWIKLQTPAPSTTKKRNTAENHDAFEWLVVHVVIPNTVAATQPRSNGKTDDSASSRWRPGSSTLLDKMRSDFNSSTKGVTDRIAQVRIGVNDVPYDQLPRVVPAVPSGYKETAEESEAAWQDFLAKVKSLILASFDSRVSQYEEDIKERDAQRSLPGWNFCTFFILKEGLARGFESVGLVEDALVGYDELSIGLDMVMKDQTMGDSGSTTNAMLSYTNEIKRLADKAKEAAFNSGDDGEEVVDMQAQAHAYHDTRDSSFEDIPISSTKKPYRELILENKVSLFDFRCYVFARQIALLLRLANAWSTREELLAKLKEQQEGIVPGVAPRAPPPKQVENDKENLPMLAEICRRTVEFIPSVSQVMRRDIEAALAGKRRSVIQESTSPLDAATLEVVENLVASFAFSIAQQILAQTSTKALPIPPSTFVPSDGHEPKAAIPEPKTMMHPARNSSLRVGTGGAGGALPLPSPAFFNGLGQTGSEQDTARNNAFLKVGLEDLAARRAELYTLSRNILEQCGKKRGWSDGWAGVPLVGESTLVDMVEIDLDGDTASTPELEKAVQFSPVSLAGIENRLLLTALDNEQDFYRLYEMLTDKALRHYNVANRLHSAQSSLADLAILKYHLGDFGAAASLFWRTTPFFGENGWSLLELAMLVLYSRCLKQLQRKDEYIKVMLKLLSKAAAAEGDRLRRRSSLRIGQKPDVAYPDGEAIKGLLGDLLEETKSLQDEIRVPLSSFFSTVEVDATPEYRDDRDGFSISLEVSCLLIDELKMDKARLQMVSHVADSQREIWLELSEPVIIKPGRNRIKLDGNVSRYPLESF
jgi:trafficking protein particle complex subunit 10